MHKTGTILLALLLCAATATLSQAQASSPALKAIKAKFLSGKVFRAQLVNRFIDPTTRDTVRTSGRIWIGKKQYKIEMAGRSIVVDGQTSRVYSAGKNQLIISSYDPTEDDYAPSRFLSGNNHEYLVRQQKTPMGDVTVELLSRDPFSMFKRVEITVNTHDVPLTVSSVDQTGNVTLSTFSDGEYVMGRPDLFAMQVPDSVRVIDLRKE